MKHTITVHGEHSGPFVMLDGGDTYEPPEDSSNSQDCWKPADPGWIQRLSVRGSSNPSRSANAVGARGNFAACGSPPATPRGALHAVLSSSRSTWCTRGNRVGEGLGMGFIPRPLSRCSSRVLVNRRNCPNPCSCPPHNSFVSIVILCNRRMSANMDTKGLQRIACTPYIYILGLSVGVTSPSSTTL